MDVFTSIQVLCPQRADVGFMTNRPTLIFVVRANLAIQSVVNKVADQIMALAEELAFDSSYLQHFALLAFRKDGKLLATGLFFSKL